MAAPSRWICARGIAFTTSQPSGAVAARAAAGAGTGRCATAFGVGDAARAGGAGAGGAVRAGAGRVAGAGAAGGGAAATGGKAGAGRAIGVGIAAAGAAATGLGAGAVRATGAGAGGAPVAGSGAAGLRPAPRAGAESRGTTTMAASAIDRSRGRRRRRRGAGGPVRATRRGGRRAAPRPRCPARAPAARRRPRRRRAPRPHSARLPGSSSEARSVRAPSAPSSSPLSTIASARRPRSSSTVLGRGDVPVPGAPALGEEAILERALQAGERFVAGRAARREEHGDPLAGVEPAAQGLGRLLGGRSEEGATRPGGGTRSTSLACYQRAMAAPPAPQGLPAVPGGCRALLLRELPSIALVLLACVQVGLVFVADLSPWKGGGFGMFSTNDHGSFRSVRVFAEERRRRAPHRRAADRLQALFRRARAARRGRAPRLRAIARAGGAGARRRSASRCGARSSTARSARATSASPP